MFGHHYDMNNFCDKMHNINIVSYAYSDRASMIRFSRPSSCFMYSYRPIFCHIRRALQSQFVVRRCVLIKHDRFRFFFNIQLKKVI